MSKCQLYAKGKKIYPITNCENIMIANGSNLSSQLNNIETKKLTSRLSII